MPDLAVSGGSGLVAILEGNGDGTFQPASFFVAGREPFGITDAGVNGGKPYLAVADQFPGGVTVLFNTTR